MVKAKDVMTPSPEICKTTDTAHDAVKIMYNRDCGIVPVVDDNGVIKGVVTDRDICLDIIMNRKDPDRTKLKEIMTVDPLTCGPDEDCSRFLQDMEKRQVRRIVVVDRADHPVGIISEGDIAQRDPEREEHVEELVEAVTAS